MVEITTRAGKGAPVTSSEMDQTLINLKNAIEALMGLNVVGWTQDPDDYTLTIELSDGTFIGPITLPPRPVRPTGEWMPQTYAVADLVVWEGSSFYCNEAGPSEDFEDEYTAGKWILLVGAPPEGSTGGGGSGTASTIINVTRPGAMADGVIMSLRAPIAMEMKTSHPILIDLETAPGVGNSFDIVVALNGTTVGSIPVSGTTDSLSIPINMPVSAGAKVTIALANTSGAGAAADLGITTYWTPTA